MYARVYACMSESERVCGRGESERMESARGARERGGTRQTESRRETRSTSRVVVECTSESPIKRTFIYLV